MTGLKQRLSRRSASGDARDGKARIPGFLRWRPKAQRPPWGRRAQQPTSTSGEDGAPAAPLAAPSRRSRLPGLAKLRQALPWGRRAAPSPAAGADGETAAQVVESAGSSSFRDRGKLRRRLQYLRRARELAFRDVGGLMFDMRRFDRERPDLVEAKLSALGAVDDELRALERVLDDRRPIHELREPGLSSCQRCGALHASEDNFCPHCGLQFGGALAMGEVGGAIAGPPQAPVTGAVAAPPPPPPAPPAPAAPPAASPAPPAAKPAERGAASDPADEPTQVNRPSDAS